MNKLFLTMLFAFSTMFASAQWVALTTVNKVEGVDAVEPSTTEVYDGDVCPTTSTEIHGILLIKLVLVIKFMNA